MTPVEGTFQRGGFSLRTIDVDGAGVPVVLLHGVSDGADGFVPTLKHLAGRHPATAVSLRGHGGSGFAGSYGLDDYAEDVEDLIDVRFGRPVVLAGHSLGSMIVPRIAVRRPDLAAGLLIEDSPYLGLISADPATREFWFDAFRETQRVAADRDDPDFVEQVGALTARIPGRDLRMRDLASPRFIELRAATLAQLDPTVFDPILAETLVAGFPPTQVASITCPVSIVAGNPALGGVMPDADLAEWSRLLPQARVTVAEKAGHPIHQMSDPVRREYLAVLDGLLDDVNETATS